MKMKREAARHLHKIGRGLSWVFVAAAASGLAACGSSPLPTSSSNGAAATNLGAAAQNSGSIKIGVMTNDTGAYSTLGGPLRNAAQMIFDQFNQAGGVGGNKIDPIYLDGQTSPNLAVTQAHQLVSDHVAAVIGVEFGTAAHAVAPIFEAAHIPVVTVTADETITTPVNPWIFDVSPAMKYNNQRVASYLSCKDITRVAVLHDTESLGVQGNADLLASVQNRGVRVVADQSYDLTGTNFETQLMALGQTSAQAIVYWGVGTAPVTIVKEYSALGIKAALIGGPANADPTFLSQVTPAVNGMVDVTTPADLLKHLPASTPDKADLLNFSRSYSAKFNQPFGLFPSLGHDAAEVIVTALKAGATTPQLIQQQLNDNFTVQGFNGTIHFSSTDHTGVQLSDMVMARIVNGEAEPTKCQ